MKNPLDELDSLLKERQLKRKTFLASFLDSLGPIVEGSRKWFDYEVEAVTREIGFLETIMPEETPAWKNELKEIKGKFERAEYYIIELAKKAEKGELQSVSEIYKGRPQASSFVIPSPNTAREQTPLDIAESLLEIWDAASTLEKLVNRVEHEALRTLRLRRLVKLEIEERRS